MEQLRKNIYFASDAHLGNRYTADSAETERKLVRWLDSIKQDAIAIYFLGDMFDYWYEYKYVVPKGFVRFLGKLGELSDLGVEIHLLRGNHDIWMFDYLAKEIGAKIYQGPLTLNLLGKRFFLAHGDEVGKHSRTFRFLQAMFRNPVCQFLYSSIHPWWTFRFAQRWSLNSRLKGLDKETDVTDEDITAKPLIDFAETYYRTHPEINYFIFGHRHIIVNHALSETSRVIIAGDWMQYFSYIRWDGKELGISAFC
ncbi:MAG: UDP-2,3-diacylglucosamine diphosphatase [Tannerella sp.]|nr:UDP-2,3-diacylglucosamine diphosphatase [Tannerella sp.]